MKIDIPDQSNVVDHYGPSAQAYVHMEELAELIQMISKMRRYSGECDYPPDAFYNLVGEVADVLVSIEQIKLIYGIPDDFLQEMILMKCARQEKRMLEE